MKKRIVKWSWWPIDKVTPYETNARIHDPGQVAQIASSIESFGWRHPILVDADGVIIAGHGRRAAAEHLGLAEVPVIVNADLGPEQVRLLRLADNKIAENSKWDEGLLATELAALNELGLDLEITGFDEVEINKSITAFLEGASDEGDEASQAAEEVPPVPEVPVSALGDVWLLGDHRIICGDSTDADVVSKLLNGETPHLMVTDPPYGVEYDPTWRDEAGGQFGNGKTKMRGKVENDDRADWRDAWSLFDGDIAYVWHAALKTREVVESLEAVGFELKSHIIWVKSHFTLGRSAYHWQHEPCAYVVKSGRSARWVGDRKQTTVWDIAGMNPAGRNRDEGNEKTSHGTQKPVECMKRPISNNSMPGDAIYEPFSGSGTTIIACEMTGRRCFAIELSPAYVDVAVKRWQEFTGKQAVLLGSEQTFSDVLAARASTPKKPRRERKKAA